MSEIKPPVPLPNSYWVVPGQFLMQIDPRTLRTRVESGQAALRGAESALEQARQGVETARVQLNVAQQALERQLGEHGIDLNDERRSTEVPAAPRCDESLTLACSS